MDREKVIKALELCANGCNDDGCVYLEEQNRQGGLVKCRCVDLLARDALDLLKEQEAVKPVLDEQTGRLWLCGNCGSYVGFEDNDPHDPNEFDKYCRECGKPVLWEGR